MNNESLLRLVWAVGIIASGLGLYWLATRAILARARSASRSADITSFDSPWILYFTTPDCVPCKTIQRPALEKVKTTLGQQFQVVEVNAYEQPDMAKKWGVLSVPTTIILDARGTPRHVNFGATGAEKLFKQLSEAL
jgi:thiol-disulfide isomerase/thioredoxin